jgi:hypothetical protein
MRPDYLYCVMDNSIQWRYEKNAQRYERWRGIGQVEGWGEEDPDDVPDFIKLFFQLGGFDA